MSKGDRPIRRTLDAMVRAKGAGKGSRPRHNVEAYRKNFNEIFRKNTKLK